MPASSIVAHRAILFLVCCGAVLVLPAARSLDLKSADIADHGVLGARQVLDGFGCKGGDQSPQLTWRDPPAGTRSFALTVYDPDAPTGSGWWHWVVYDIPVETRSLPAGAAKSGRLPAGAVQGRNDFGSTAFGGACPPTGDKPHRYVVTLHALKVYKLPLPAAPSAAMVGFMVHANSLGNARLTATYVR